MTGLKGGYDFSITWTPSGITRGAAQARPGDAAVFLSYAAAPLKGGLILGFPVALARRFIRRIAFEKRRESAETITVVRNLLSKG